MKHKKTLISLIVVLATITCQVTLLNGMDNKGKNEPMGSGFLLENVFTEKFINLDSQNTNKNDLMKKTINDTIKETLNNNHDKNTKGIAKKSSERAKPTCKHCGKSGFSTKTNLNRHEKGCSENKNREEYNCQYCQKKLSQQGYLNRHEKRCSGKPNNKQAIQESQTNNDKINNNFISIQSNGNSNNDDNQSLLDDYTPRELLNINNDNNGGSRQQDGPASFDSEQGINEDGNGSEIQKTITLEEIFNNLKNNNNENLEKNKEGTEYFINPDSQNTSKNDLMKKTINYTIKETLNNNQDKNTKGITKKSSERAKKRTCKHCGKLGFSTKSNLTEHEKRCSKNSNRQANQTCQYCGSEYAPSYITEHEKRCSKNSNRQAKQTCQYCGGNYAPSYLTEHEKGCLKNENRKEYKCQYCQQELSCQHSLTQHEKDCSENPDREEHKCQYCQKKFSRQGTLTAHAKICLKNENGQECKCQYCQKKLSQQGYLNRHEKRCSGKPNNKQAIQESQTNNDKINNNFISIQSNSNGNSNNDDNQKKLLDDYTPRELLNINNDNNGGSRQQDGPASFDPEQGINEDGNGSEIQKTITLEEIFNNLKNNNNENLEKNKEGTEKFINLDSQNTKKNDLNHKSLNINNGNNLINTAIINTIKKTLNNQKNTKGITKKSSSERAKQHKEYKCQYCQQEFSSQNYLIYKHEKSCRQGIKYMCDCSMGFSTQNSFDRHKNNCRVWYNVSMHNYVTNYIATQKEKDKGKID